MNTANIGAGLGGLSVLGGAVTMLASGTPVRDLHLDFDAGLQHPVEQVEQCLSSAEGLQAWLSEVSAQPVAVTDAGGRYRVSVGEHTEWWEPVEAADGTFSYTVRFDKVTLERTLRLAPEGDGSSLVWIEDGRLPAFSTLILLGEDVGLEAFLDAADALGAARC